MPTYLLCINSWLFRFGRLANDVTITVISEMPRRHMKIKEILKKAMIMHLFHSNFRNLSKMVITKKISLNLIFEPYSSTKNALSLTDVTVIFRDICVRNLAHIGPFAALVEYTMVRLRSFRSILL